MKYISVYNRKGDFIQNVIVDDDDFDMLSEFKWSIAIKVRKNGTVEAYANTSLKIDGKHAKIPMHRMIMSAQNGYLVDHINGNSLDNRKENLRICTHSQNSTNTAPRGKSKYVGVCIKKVKKSSGKIHSYYSAAIKAKGVYKHLGSFPFTKEGEALAAKAYIDAAREKYGDFVLQNNYYNRESHGVKPIILKPIQNERGKIFTSTGVTAFVSDEDYDELIKINWYAEKQLNGNYYAVNRRKGKGRIYMHRLIMKPSSKSILIDHIDGNGMNNRRDNLREVSALQNSWNKRAKITSTSKYLGVSWDSRNKKWKASIKHNSKNITIGLFNEEIEAAEKYNIFAKKCFGEYARLNNIQKT